MLLFQARALSEEAPHVQTFLFLVGVEPVEVD